MKVLTIEQNKKQANTQFKRALTKYCKDLKEYEKEIKIYNELPEDPKKEGENISVSCVFFLEYKKSGGKIYYKPQEPRDPMLKYYLKHCGKCEELVEEKLYYKTYYTVEDAVDSEYGDKIGTTVEKHEEWLCKKHSIGLMNRVQAKKKYLEEFPE